MQSHYGILKFINLRRQTGKLNIYVRFESLKLFKYVTIKTKVNGKEQIGKFIGANRIKG